MDAIGLTITNGYLLNFEAKDGRRTYACADRVSLIALIKRLTGRDEETFLKDDRGLPEAPVLFNIAAPLHIYWNDTRPFEGEVYRRCEHDMRLGQHCNVAGSLVKTDYLEGLRGAAREAVEVGPGCDGKCPRDCKHEVALKDLAKAVDA